MKKKSMGEFPLLHENEGIPLFYPNISKSAIDEVVDTLSGRWIGQGPKVNSFENEFKKKYLGNKSALAVGSGTDALHLSYLLSNINPGDDVLVPVFTCTATNIPLLYIGANPIFIDIDPLTMNISVDDVVKKITKKTKALVCVDYGGMPCDYKQLNEICKEYKLKLISDAAHSLGSKYKGQFSGQLADYTIFSFQAIKTLTTGDGGMLAIRDNNELSRAKRLRWFGIDRENKQGGIWENNIREIGYKYQMTDIAASMGLRALDDIDSVIKYRIELFQTYVAKLNIKRVQMIGEEIDVDSVNSAWLSTIIVDSDRVGLMKKLRNSGVESGQVHYRNDRYSIFGGRKIDLPVMDDLEDRYLVLPLHTKMNVQDVEFICEIINEGW